MNSNPSAPSSHLPLFLYKQKMERGNYGWKITELTGRNKVRLGIISDHIAPRGVEHKHNWRLCHLAKAVLLTHSASSLFKLYRLA